MNTYSRTVLRVVAFATGLYYWYGSFQLMSNHPPLNGIAKLVDYGANALCLFAVGVFLLGIGIGIWKIVLNEKFLR